MYKIVNLIVMNMSVEVEWMQRQTTTGLDLNHFMLLFFFYSLLAALCVYIAANLHFISINGIIRPDMAYFLYLLLLLLLHFIFFDCAKKIFCFSCCRHCYFYRKIRRKDFLLRRYNISGITIDLISNATQFILSRVDPVTEVRTRPNHFYFFFFHLSLAMNMVEHMDT